MCDYTLSILIENMCYLDKICPHLETLEIDDMLQFLLVRYVILNSFIFADDNVQQQFQFNYRIINFERRQNGVDARTLSSYVFCGIKDRLNHEEWLKFLQLAYENEATSRITVNNWFMILRRDQNSILNEKHTGRPLLTVSQKKTRPYEKC